MLDFAVDRPAVEPSTVYTPREIDQMWLERDRELEVGQFFVRCISQNCYRIRDGRAVEPLPGESRDGVYIYFVLE